jgi:hypothetical protein
MLSMPGVQYGEQRQKRTTDAGVVAATLVWLLTLPGSGE